LGRANEVNKNTQQVEAVEKENSAVTESPVLRAECDSSLKADFMARLGESGFRTQTDAITTLARDFASGRIQYRGGILQSQEKNENNSEQPVTRKG
jgi:hypothetical protein